MGNYMRCVSGAFYNVAGSLYQATRYGAAVPFLKESCALGGKALRLPRPVSKSANEKEWQQLEEQLFRRWELLAACYSKNGDRKVGNPQLIRLPAYSPKTWLELILCPATSHSYISVFLFRTDSSERHTCS
jgi:hypothetical protein